MTIYYLMIKTHTITGLKYLCKTKRKDPHKYLGSGTYWLNHLKTHGANITTDILRECQNNEEVKYWGLHYSKLWNVVDDRDENGKKTWANLKPESGDGGFGDIYMENPMIRARHLAKINSIEVKEKHRIAMIDVHKNRKPETKENIRENIRKKLSDRTIYKFYHVTGIVETCSRIELISKYNLPNGHISNMIHEPHRMVKGWKVDKHYAAGTA